MVGFALGLSTTGAIFVSLAKNKLADVFPEFGDRARDSLAAGISGKLLSSLGDRDRALALDCVVEAWRRVFVPIYVVAALAVALSTLLQFKTAFPATLDRA